MRERARETGKHRRRERSEQLTPHTHQRSEVHQLSHVKDKLASIIALLIYQLVSLARRGYVFVAVAVSICFPVALRCLSPIVLLQLNEREGSRASERERERERERETGHHGYRVNSMLCV